MLLLKEIARSALQDGREEMTMRMKMKAYQSRAQQGRSIAKLLDISSFTTEVFNSTFAHLSATFVALSMASASITLSVRPSSLFLCLHCFSLLRKIVKHLLSNIASALWYTSFWMLIPWHYRNICTHRIKHHSLPCCLTHRAPSAAPFCFRKVPRTCTNGLDLVWFIWKGPK